MTLRSTLLSVVVGSAPRWRRGCRRRPAGWERPRSACRCRRARPASAPALVGIRAAVDLLGVWPCPRTVWCRPSRCRPATRSARPRPDDHHRRLDGRRGCVPGVVEAGSATVRGLVRGCHRPAGVRAVDAARRRRPGRRWSASRTSWSPRPAPMSPSSPSGPTSVARHRARTAGRLVRGREASTAPAARSCPPTPAPARSDLYLKLGMEVTSTWVNLDALQPLRLTPGPAAAGPVGRVASGPSRRRGRS